MTPSAPPPADLAALAAAVRAGNARAAIALALDVLDRHPTCAEAWDTLRRQPLLEHPDLVGLSDWLPLTRARAADIVGGLLDELAREFHAGKLLAVCDLARTCGVALPSGRIAETAGIPVLVRPIRIPPQDFPAEDTLRVDAHVFQPWVFTHNRPDGHRKVQQPFVPFVRVPGLQIERTPSPDKPECGFSLFDGAGAPIIQDTMWAGQPTSPKLLAPLSMQAAAVFGWTPEACVEGEAIFLPNRENYYHFLVETLPAAILAARLPTLRSCPLVFSRLSSWQREALAMVGVPAERLAELEALKSAGPGPDHLRFSLGWLPVDLSFALACAITREGLSVRRFPRRGARLIVSRGGGGHIARRLVNEDAVIRALEAQGFQTVLAERLSFREQVELFATAEIVVGAHGAGLTNMLHAPQQATLIELMNAACHNERAMNFSSMQRITQCNGQGYIRVVGDDEPGVGPEVFAPNRPYSVPVDDVLRAVVVAEQSAARLAPAP
jgi:hypothetical protein